MSFQRAQRRRAKLKLAITGPAGSGKTTGALRLATGLAGAGKIALIDTENGSASLYSDRFNFDVLEISPPFEHGKFVKAIRDAEAAGYSVLVIDSASHFWEGILDYKSKLDSRGGNSYTNWADAGNKFKDILEAVLQSQIHVIACLRSKMDYVLEQNDKGKATPRKVGLAPIMRDGIEYEFTSVFDVALDHNCATSKDRTGLFTDKIFQITEDTGKQFAKWLEGGADPVKPAPAGDVGEFEKASEEQVHRIDELVEQLAKTPAQVTALLKYYKVPELAKLSAAQAADAIAKLNSQLPK